MNANFVVLVGVCVLFVGGSFIYGFAFERGFNEARRFYKPMLDDAWQRSDGYRDALIALSQKEKP